MQGASNVMPGMPDMAEGEMKDFDPSLFGLWPADPAYDGLSDGGWSEQECRRHVADALIETKSAEVAPEDLRLLLNDMTREMREQFHHFRRLRASAEALCGPDADEAAARLARADIKAASDAMSLIVRTLEKIDALQRQLARDREIEAEHHAESPDYLDVRNKILEQIERRANEKASRLYAEWVAGTGPPAIGTDTGKPPRSPPGGETG